MVVGLYIKERQNNMLQEIKNWLISVSKELCSETVETAGTICDETRKQNAQFVKAIMDSLR
jgi:hypothetical protein